MFKLQQMKTSGVGTSPYKPGLYFTFYSSTNETYICTLFVWFNYGFRFTLSMNAKIHIMLQIAKYQTMISSCYVRCQTNWWKGQKSVIFQFNNNVVATS